jgi:predicted nucleic acid-binding protein
MQLVDTNVFIDHFRNYAAAINFFNSVDENTVIFSAISEAEIVAGQQCADAETKHKTLQFLGRWRKIDVTNQIAVLAGDIVREHGIELADAIIAATAQVYKARVLTRNVKHFSMIKNLAVKIPYS